MSFTFPKSKKTILRKRLTMSVWHYTSEGNSTWGHAGEAVQTFLIIIIIKMPYQEAIRVNWQVNRGKNGKTLTLKALMVAPASLYTLFTSFICSAHFTRHALCSTVVGLRPMARLRSSRQATKRKTAHWVRRDISKVDWIRGSLVSTLQNEPNGSQFGETRQTFIQQSGTLSKSYTRGCHRNQETELFQIEVN